MFNRLLGKKKYPIKNTVFKKLGNDDFLIRNIENDDAYINICFIALVTAYQAISNWHKDKQVKKYVKVTSEDILAFEIAIFTICQALQILETRNPDDDDFDLEDAGRHTEMTEAMHFMKEVFEKEYADIEPYFDNRVRRYCDSVKPACEALSFNLTNIKGAQYFSGLTEKVRLDLQTQLVLITFAMVYCKTMVPAFMESVERISEVSL
jgi:hypothetical protein